MSTNFDNVKYVYSVCLYQTYTHFHRAAGELLDSAGIIDAARRDLIIGDLFDIILHQLSVSSRYIDKPNDGTRTFYLEAIKDSMYSDISDYISEADYFSEVSRADDRYVHENNMATLCLSMVEVIYKEVLNYYLHTPHGRINSDSMSGTVQFDILSLELARLRDSTDVLVTMEFDE